MSADLSPGAQLALAGMNDAAVGAGEWTQEWERAIAYLATTGEPFTADDVRDLAGEPSDHPNACGAIFNRLAKRGVIARVGYRPSKRPILHAHPIALWIGGEAA